MKTKGITKTISRSVRNTKLKVKKHSPEILIVAGVVGTITSTVMACKATTKASKLVEETKETLNTMKDIYERPEDHDGEEYSEKDYKDAQRMVYVNTGLELVKLYAPSVILGGLSIAGIFTSNNILRKRNITLAAAYGATEQAFKNYRSNVVERFGEEVDRQLKYNLKTEEVEETTVNEKGKEKTVKKPVEVVSENNVLNSPYAKFFDASSRNWEDNAEYNLMFLRRQEQYANDLLRSRYDGKKPSTVFLNEVYDMLDIPRTALGQVAGWTYDPKKPDGDNYIDFGIYETHRKSNRDFVNGLEPVILLDFNVDGNILDRI